jgi:hypothetical protein
MLPEPVLVLEFPEATPSNNVLKGMHFRVYQKLRQSWQSMAIGAAHEYRQGNPEPIERAYLSIERHSSGGGLDWDNAYGGLKPLLDCLVCPSDRNPDGLGIIRDDCPQNMPLAPAFTQHPAKPKHGRTIVRIYDAALMQ